MSNEKYTLYDPNDAVQAVVCDMGSYATKMGFAGEDFPKSYFRSNVAVLREQPTATNQDAPTSRPIQKINYDFHTRPIEYPKDSDGDWETANPIDLATGLFYNDDWCDLFQRFVHHAFDTTLLTLPSDQPFLLAERSSQPPPMRQQLLEILMEEVQVPAAFFGRDATLACYACGRTTGTVVDVGYHGTTVTPVYEGYVELKGIRRSPVGTKEMDTMLMGHLDRTIGTPYVPLYQLRGHALRREDFHQLARLAVAQDCREDGSGAAVLQADATFQAPHMSYELPDGTKIDLPSKVRFGVSDLLLGQDDASVTTRHDLVGQRTKQMMAMMMDLDNCNEDNEPPTPSTTTSRLPFSNRHLQRACAPYISTEPWSEGNIPAMGCEAAFLCDRDQQASLLGNVILAGGGACLGPTDQALPEFFREKMEAIIHQHTPGWRVKVLSPNFQERKVCSWIGGSILGSLGSFHDMYITKKEYDEYGSAIVNRKCP